MSPLRLIKLGGSIITDKSSPTPSLRATHLIHLAQILSRHQGQLIIVIGAGSYGHPYAKRYNLNQGLPQNQSTPPTLASTHQQWQGAIKTHLSVSNLLNQVSAIFLDQNLPIFPLQTALYSNPTLQSNQTNLNFLRQLLKQNLIPILHGDISYDPTHPKTIQILSGDDLMVHLANHLNPTQIDFATSGDGIYLNQTHIPTITRPELLSRLNQINQTQTNTDITGSFLAKVQKISSQTRQTPIHIYDGTTPTNFQSAFLNNHNGSWIT